VKALKHHTLGSKSRVYVMHVTVIVSVGMSLPSGAIEHAVVTLVGLFKEDSARPYKQQRGVVRVCNDE